MLMLLLTQLACYASFRRLEHNIHAVANCECGPYNKAGCDNYACDSKRHFLNYNFSSKTKRL